MLRGVRSILLPLALLAGSIGNSWSQVFITESGKAEFISDAPLREFSGTSEKLNGLIDLSQNLLDFYLDLNTLKTGIGLRDRHMRENYLETKKHPFAEFSGKLDEIPDLRPGMSSSVTASGHFTIHGVKKPLVVSGQLTMEDMGYLRLEAGFTVLLSDFNISIPKLVFYELAEEQKVRISATLNPKTNE